MRGWFRVLTGERAQRFLQINSLSACFLHSNLAKFIPKPELALVPTSEAVEIVMKVANYNKSDVNVSQIYDSAILKELIDFRMQNIDPESLNLQKPLHTRNCQKKGNIRADLTFQDL